MDQRASSLTLTNTLSAPTHSLSGNVLEGRRATNQSKFSLGRPLGRLKIYGVSIIFADTREITTEHPRCPRSDLQPHQEASQGGWEEISTGEGGRCQSKVACGRIGEGR